MAERAWKIRDQQPDGSWGPEREVTLEQYKAEISAAAIRAKQIFNSSKAAIRKATGEP